MAYFKPYIDASGLHIPTYKEIRDQLISDSREIFGNDIYLDNDSQDYQWISSVSSMLHDSYLLLVAIYNNRGPRTAIGSGLDGVVKLNGIKRKEASYSTCVLTLSGASGTIIENGICQDSTGTRWMLPSSVKIGSDGVVTISARSEWIGAYSALPDTITTIVTPTLGWKSVTNDAAAIVGEEVEKDSSLRARQTISTMLSSQALLDGTRGAIQEVQNVSRSKVYENDTNTPDKDGLPPHSICAVVEGGLDNEIAQAIFLHKTPGCYTYGDVVVPVRDEAGMTMPIRFFRPSYISIDVTVKVKALDGYTSSKTSEINARVTDYIKSLHIGEDVYNSSLWGAALLPVVSLEKPVYAVTEVRCAITGNPLWVQDLPIDFKSVTEAGNIEVEVL